MEQTIRLIKAAHNIKYVALKEALIVEDDRDIAELVAIHLRDLDFSVQIADNGPQGYGLASQKAFDLIVLDLMLPGMDGLELCSRLRKDKNTAPVVMLTSRTEEIDKVRGLEYGADMYTTKPFNIVEFKAMLKALFRRIAISRSESGAQCELIQAHNMVIDLTKRSVYIHERRIDLTAKEFDLLAQLASHPGRSYSREQLLSLIWGYEYQAYAHTVNSHINRLRAKIEADIAHPKFILTSWGVGVPLYRRNFMRLLNKLYWKIFGVFFLITVALGSIYILLTAKIVKAYSEEANQRLHASVAGKNCYRQQTLHRWYSKTNRLSDSSFTMPWCLTRERKSIYWTSRERYCLTPHRIPWSNAPALIWSRFGNLLLPVVPFSSKGTIRAITAPKKSFQPHR